jgi:putative lipoic acid-binding regulatory protein
MDDQERREALRQRLNEIHKWPSVFMFKFILPNDPDRLSKLKMIFGESAQFTMKFSEKGRYTSLTVREMMLDADAIFDRYLAASHIEGIIAL